MFEDLKVIEKIPDQEWVNRLRIGNYIWLVKEKSFGVVEQEFEPPEPETIAGRLGFKKAVCWVSNRLRINTGLEIDPKIELLNWTNQTWIVRANGCGLDFNPLILPVEGHLADDPPPIDEPVIRQLKRTIANLEHRVNILEQGIWMADALSGLTPTTNFPEERNHE